jgi:2-succinyl-5-enolpyruvyl-6-hydroxy-3-cyclohexene-1-carboxylate synthase
MALALRAAPALRSWVHLDERAGAFFALGAARASRRPVAVLVTSGTAAVELAPAVVEARYGRVPLILLTADRPPELQGIGASQTIDQVELYGRHAKWFAALPVPESAAEAEAEVRAIVARAIDVAQAAPAGPVQLDLPFREPLLPHGSVATEAIAEGDADDKTGDRSYVEPEVLERLEGMARASARPLIVCGPTDRSGFASALAALASALRAPVLADALSNVRTGPHDRSAVVAHHDWLVRTHAKRERHRPDHERRFGDTPTSKGLGRMLDELDVPQVLVDDGGGWNRPSGTRLVRVDADPVAFAAAGAEAVGGQASADPGWASAWLDADDAVRSALHAWRAAIDEPFEGDVPPALVEALPEGTLVLVGNSMPVRDLDAFLPGSERALRFVGNRGASGIDGLLSTALGLAAAQDEPVVAVVGDLAFLHDVTALAAGARLGLDLTVVLVDNDGGGIFSFLPQAGADDATIGLPQHYEELFGTPHGLELGPVAVALGARHQRVGPVDLASALRQTVGRGGIHVLELRTDRRRNVELHRGAYEAAERALEAMEEGT